MLDDLKDGFVTLESDRQNHGVEIDSVSINLGVNMTEAMSLHDTFGPHLVGVESPSEEGRPRNL